MREHKEEVCLLALATRAKHAEAKPDVVHIFHNEPKRFSFIGSCSPTALIAGHPDYMIRLVLERS